MATLESTVQMAYAIKDTYDPSFREGVYRNDAVLNVLRQCGMVETMATGGTKHNWHLNTTGNTSVAVFTEASGAPQSVAQGWARASVSWVYYWGYIAISGMARDAMKDGGNFDAVEAAMNLTMRDIVDLRSTTMLGSTNNGLQQAISATTTYAGITRGSAGYFESSTSSSTFSIANLRSLYRSMRSPDKGGRLTASLVSPTVAEIYAAIGGTPTAQSNSTLRYMALANGSAPAYDYGYSSLSFMGAPVFEVPDLTSTIWIMLDGSAENIKHVIIRPFDVKFHHNEGDNEIYEVSTGSTLVVEQPKWQAIMTSVS